MLDRSSHIAERSGAQIILHTLADVGVDVIFGYPGGAVLPIYDELLNQNSIRHILGCHEAGAVPAAEGYARSTGRPVRFVIDAFPQAQHGLGVFALWG